MNGMNLMAKINRFARLALALVLVWLVLGSQPSHAEATPISPIALVGKWSGSEKMPDGNTVVVQLAFTQSQKFTGSSAVNGKIFWTYSGTWEVNGNQLTWHYEESSRALPESAKMDVDEIVALDAEKLVLLSRLNGKQSTFLRAK
jgi:hypothetical protein